MNTTTTIPNAHDEEDIDIPDPEEQVEHLATVLDQMLPKDIDVWVSVDRSRPRFDRYFLEVSDDVTGATVLVSVLESRHTDEAEDFRLTERADHFLERCTRAVNEHREEVRHRLSALAP